MNCARFIRHFGFCLSLLFSAISSDASQLAEERPAFKTAEALFEIGYQNEAQKVLEKLTRQYPQEGLYWFNLGQFYLANGDEEKALKSYRRVLKTRSPLKPMARVEASKIFRKRKKWIKATRVMSVAHKKTWPLEVRYRFVEEKVTLSKKMMEKCGEAKHRQKWKILGLCQKQLAVLSEDKKISRSIASLEPKDRSVLRWSSETLQRSKLFEEWERLNGKEREPSPWQLFMGASFGYDDNVFLVNSEDGTSHRATWNAYLNTDYRIVQTQHWSWHWQYLYYWDQALAESQSETQFHRIQIPLSWKNSSWQWNLTPRLSTQVSVGTQAENLFGLNMALKWFRGKNVWTVEVDRSESSGIGAGNDYLSGETTLVDLEFQRVGPIFQWGVGLGYTDDRNGDFQIDETDILALAHNAWRVNASMAYRWSPQWKMSSDVSYAERNYGNKKSGERDDEYSEISLRLSHYWKPTLVFYLNFGWIENQSTFDGSSVDNRNYRQNTGVFGVNWQFK